MLKNNTFSKTINTKELVDKYLDLSLCTKLCKQCPNYAKSWSCPPFEKPFDFSKYKNVELILKKIDVSSNCSFNELFKKSRIDFDKYILNLEEQKKDSLAFYAGSCIICDLNNCTRLKNKPCNYPKQQRLSLESIGFNVAKISEEIFNIKIQWSNNSHTPKYLTMIACLFI